MSIRRLAARLFISFFSVFLQYGLRFTVATLLSYLPVAEVRHKSFRRLLTLLRQDGLIREVDATESLQPTAAVTDSSQYIITENWKPYSANLDEEISLLKNQLFASCPRYINLTTLLARCGDSLALVLQEKAVIQELIFAEGIAANSLYQDDFRLVQLIYPALSRAIHNLPPHQSSM